MATNLMADCFSDKLSEARRNADAGWPTVMKDDSGEEYVLLTRARYLNLLKEGPTLFEASSAMEIPGVAEIPDEVWDNVMDARHSESRPDAS